jgi:hypothetical protein
MEHPYKEHAPCIMRLNVIPIISTNCREEATTAGKDT